MTGAVLEIFAHQALRFVTLVWNPERVRCLCGDNEIETQSY